MEQELPTAKSYRAANRNGEMYRLGLPVPGLLVLVAEQKLLAEPSPVR